jgi:hypothetical protein
MHLPQAYRSLPRPSSLSKPSHPPTGVVAPALVYFGCSCSCSLYEIIVVVLLVTISLLDDDDSSNNTQLLN